MAWIKQFKGVFRPAKLTPANNMRVRAGKGANLFNLHHKGAKNTLCVFGSWWLRADPGLKTVFAKPTYSFDLLPQKLGYKK